MSKIKIIGFDKNIFEKAMFDENRENTTYIFNSQIEASKAQSFFQKKIGFTENQFLVLSEWEENILDSDYPILKEDRRLIAFYNSLSDENKRFFKISDYFQSVKFAYKFFNFWEEFAENLLNDSVLKIKFDNEYIFENENQMETFRMLKSIKNAYKIFINKKNFSDKIFQSEDFKITKIDSDLIFINIRNFTELQKKIVEEFEKQGFTAKIYFWGDDQVFNKSKLSLNSFSFKDLDNLSQKNISIYIGNNADNSFYDFLENGNNSDFLIDFNLEESPYYHLLNSDSFDFGNSVSFRESPIFLFFTTLNSLLHDLIYEKNENQYLIPIYSLINAIKEKRFAKYFLEDNSDEYLIPDVISFLNNLWDDKSLRYLDLSNQVLKYFKRKSDICDYIKNITGLLYSILSIKNIKDFCDFIGKNEPIEIEKIITEDEIKKYNFLELFYRALADFSVIEDIIEIKNRDKMFHPSKFKDKNIAVSQGIIRLFLEYLKSKNSRVEYHKNEKKIKISQFDKTDYVFRKNIAILNLIESNLPSKRQNRFFWTEYQRGKLGLKTIEDISLENKYRLYQMISLANSSHLYTYNDPEENIEISSFVEELRLDVAGIKIFKNTKNYSYRKLVETNFLSNGKIKINPDYKTDKKFYSFEFDEHIFEQSFSYYSLQMLMKNPFMFFLNKLKINEIEVTDEQYFSNKFLGILIHSVLNNNWQRILEAHNSATFKHDFTLFENNGNIEKSLKSYIENNPFYYFQIPHNFSARYFDLIIKPIIIENSTFFFKKFGEKFNFNNELITVFSEKNDEHQKSSEKIIFPKNDGLTSDIKIKVRADLRVESKNNKVIIDYKTGLGSDDQLLIYERYYYDNFENLKSAIFSFFEKKFNNEIESKNREKKFNKLREKLEETFLTIKSDGFSIPTKSYNSFDSEDLSRTDIFKKYGRQS